MLMGRTRGKMTQTNESSFVLFTMSMVSTYAGSLVSTFSFREVCINEKVNVCWVQTETEGI